MGGVWLAKHRRKQYFEGEFVVSARHEVPCNWFRGESLERSLERTSRISRGIVLRVRVLPCTLKRLEIHLLVTQIGPFFVDHQFESFVTCNSEDMNVDVRGGADVYVGMDVEEDEDVHVHV